MTPVQPQGRTATISLTAQQEEIVRRGFDPAKPFEEAVVQMILEKLRRNLEVSDIMLRRMDEPRLEQKLIDF
jgi:hypothetical protein